MKKNIWVRGSVVAAMVAMVPLATTVQAFAATTSFDSQYQSNATQETNLLNTAQSSSFSDSYTVSLKNTVQNIDNQISALYTAEQTLASQQASTDQLQQQLGNQQTQNLVAQIQQLIQQRQALLQETQSAWQQVNQWFHQEDSRHGKNKFKEAHDNWGSLNKELHNVSNQLNHMKDNGHHSEDNNQQEDGQSQSKAYDNGLKSLQDSILNLQQAAIQYTQDWILEEQNNGSGSSGSGSQSLPTPTVSVNNSGNTNTVTVSNALSGANVIVYNANTNNQAFIGTVTTSGTVVFSNLTPGTYYVVQTENGVTSNHSNTFTVSNTTTLSTPSISVSSSGGLTTVVATGNTSHATVRLYNTSNTLIQSVTADSSGKATFTQVPQGTYYVNQYLNGNQSSSSNQVTVNNELTTPSIALTSTNGVYGIAVTGGVPNAVLNLYNSSNNSLVGEVTLDASGSGTFGNVSTGSYYAVENYNNTNSPHTNTVYIN